MSHLKTILTLCLFACYLSACCLSADTPVFTALPPHIIFDASKAHLVTFDSFDTALPSTLSISCGSGVISIDFKTGHVDLPKGVPIDKAATDFWQKVTEAFPDFKAQVIGDALKEKDAIIAKQAEQIQRDQEVMMPPVTGPITPPLTTMWGDDYMKAHPKAFKDSKDGHFYFVEWSMPGENKFELGLRSDGVVVWREIKP
jgi:hypothetical protein